MKLPETGEANSTIATRDGGGEGLFWWALRLNMRAQDEGHVSDRLSVVGTSTVLILLHPAAAKRCSKKTRDKAVFKTRG